MNQIFEGPTVYKQQQWEVFHIKIKRKKEIHSGLYTLPSSDSQYLPPDDPRILWHNMVTDYQKLINCERVLNHFAVVSSVTWPLDGSEAGGDLVLMKTSLLLLCKSSWKKGHIQPRCPSKARSPSRELWNCILKRNKRPRWVLSLSPRYTHVILVSR